MNWKDFFSKGGWGYQVSILVVGTFFGMFFANLFVVKPTINVAIRTQEEIEKAQENIISAQYEIARTNEQMANAVDKIDATFESINVTQKHLKGLIDLQEENKKIIPAPGEQ